MTHFWWICPLTLQLTYLALKSHATPPAYQIFRIPSFLWIESSWNSRDWFSLHQFSLLCCCLNYHFPRYILRIYILRICTSIYTSSSNSSSSDVPSPSPIFFPASTVGCCCCCCWYPRYWRSCCCSASMLTLP